MSIKHERIFEETTGREEVIFILKELVAWLLLLNKMNCCQEELGILDPPKKH